MNKKDLIFFSQDGQGLTSTSANHVANMAQEMVRGIEASLDNLVFYSTRVSLIGSETTNILEHGATAADIEAVAGKLRATAKAKSLIAWLREAIKAKERLLKEAEDLSLEEWAKESGIELSKAPEMGHILTEDEYYASLTLDERNRYYETETVAAVIGEAIHPDGSFANARKNLTDHIQRPREVSGDGRDTLIYTFEPTVSDELVEETYFSLQKQYREAQARLNSMKFDCQRAVTESAVKAKTEYAEAVKRFGEERRLLEARRAEHIQRQVKEISGYKIVIPASLQDIFDEVNRLGKK